ncbi:MAG: FIST C-terminal domain-containing protein [Desulfovibrio sp.]|jgi:hypothetical protein|nr:FIST C-terminal domain-containing protein [Desulfovibrio sp.]
MIRLLTAYTCELDDINGAVDEIMQQLQLEKRLLRHSVGILAFHPEFLETGVVKAVSDALPFDAVGGTASTTAVTGAMGDLMLTVGVLTSDDILFRTGACCLAQEEPQAAIQRLYARLVPPFTEKPALLFTLAPVMADFSGDDFIAALDAVSGGVPVFGSLPFTHMPDSSGIEICCNGEHHAGLFTLVAMFGEVNPEFYHTDIPDDRIIHKKAVITGAVKNRIQSINNIASLDYLESIGLAEKGSIAGIGALPFVLTLDDGSRVVRSAYSIAGEGEILTYGAVPQGAKIGFADGSAAYVLQSVKDDIARAVAARGSSDALIVSCEGRKWTIGTDATAEIKELAEHLDRSCAYQFAYAAGELCPVKNLGGRTVNAFHNFSMIACVLRSGR